MLSLAQWLWPFKGISIKWNCLQWTWTASERHKTLTTRWLGTGSLWYLQWLHRLVRSWVFASISSVVSLSMALFMVDRWIELNALVWCVCNRVINGWFLFSPFVSFAIRWHIIHTATHRFKLYEVDGCCCFCNFVLERRSRRRKGTHKKNGGKKSRRSRR